MFPLKLNLVPRVSTTKEAEERDPGNKVEKNYDPDREESKLFHETANMSGTHARVRNL